MLLTKFCTELIIGLMKEWSGWIVELVESQYINISTYRPLSGRSYVQLPNYESKRRKKGLINITIKSVFFSVMLGLLIL